MRLRPRRAALGMSGNLDLGDPDDFVPGGWPGEDPHFKNIYLFLLIIMGDKFGGYPTAYPNLSFAAVVRCLICRCSHG